MRLYIHMILCGREKVMKNDGYVLVIYTHDIVRKSVHIDVYAV